MKSLARLIIRPPGDLILGSLTKTGREAGILNPAKVYELYEAMDVLCFRELGDSTVGDRLSTSMIPEVSWMNSPEQILEVGGKTVFLTREELTIIRNHQIRRK